MGILFVISEHREALTPELTGRYARAAARLGDVAGTALATAQYAELDGLDGVSALVLSGSFAPWSVHDPAALDRLGETVRAFDGPVLGICAGMQLQVRFAGGAIGPSAHAVATGFAPVEVVDDEGLLAGLPAPVSVYHHHGDEVTRLPDGFRVLARSTLCAVEAIAATARPWWGTQFHPEEFSTEHPQGERVLANFFALAGVT